MSPRTVPGHTHSAPECREMAKTPRYPTALRRGAERRGAAGRSSPVATKAVTKVFRLTPSALSSPGKSLKIEQRERFCRLIGSNRPKDN
jgi:hypothetical protein